MRAFDRLHPTNPVPTNIGIEIMRQLSDGTTIVGMGFQFPRGVQLLHIPSPRGRIPAVSVLSKVDVDIHSNPDRFGIKEHEHELGRTEGSLDEVLAKASRSFGAPTALMPFLFRYLPHPTNPDIILHVTLIFMNQGGPWGPEGGAAVIGFATDCSENAAALVNAAIEADPDHILEHDKMPWHGHWTPSASPMPFSAALWIFQQITAEELAREIDDCNCRVHEDSEGNGREHDYVVDAAINGEFEDA